ncbi:MAG: hypothetical protein ACOXZH_07700 [Bacteroidales bacterium]|jgi:hypothetical protein|nr:hypothetical protein [Bacteroidales bacterium]
MKIRKNKAVLFTCNFFCFLVFSVILSKFVGHFKSGPSSWKEIAVYSPLYIIGSLIFAVRITWGGGSDDLIDFFANRRKKKRINKTSEDGKNENKPNE